MTTHKLKIAFLWHQHQPYYKDTQLGKFIMPWTRLHGIKDYVDILKTLEQFPKVKFNVNLVPTMLEQILEYYEKGITDNVMDLTLKNPENFLAEDFNEFYEFFFCSNEDNLVSRLPRYKELFAKKEQRSLQTQEIRDVQALFNLSWLGEHSRKNEPFASLIKKGKNFSETDKEKILKGQLAILKEVIPIHKKLEQNGQIELSVTPFYHPILPLLCDTNKGKEANSSGTSPRFRFNFPEDARKQIQLSQTFFEKHFGKKNQGMWPSEGSVSEEVLKIAKEEGISWFATDEEILFKSLNSWERTKLFKVYEFNGVKMLFRDHGLSDLIGFTYSKWKPEEAAENLVSHFENIRKQLLHSGSNLKENLVSVILDGENCWEYYQNNGKDFLEHLCKLLGNSHFLETVKISDFLVQQNHFEQLPKIAAGSWIYGNFDIWIGSHEKNKAWDLLTETRKLIQEEEVKKTSKKLVEQAKNFVYIAEGSDWFWWFGDQNKTKFKPEFDRLFRNNLMEVYKIFGKEIPQKLKIPVFALENFEEKFIDFLPYSALQWQKIEKISEINCLQTGGTMHKAENKNILKKVFYGFSGNQLSLGILFENGKRISDYDLILGNQKERFLLNSNCECYIIFVKGKNFLEVCFSPGFRELNLLVCKNGEILEEFDLGLEK
ncbi:glycoside hydrolase [bacterium]|nr:glycoside hydrolase [bacterium]